MALDKESAGKIVALVDELNKGYEVLTKAGLEALNNLEPSELHQISNLWLPTCYNSASRTQHNNVNINILITHADKLGDKFKNLIAEAFQHLSPENQELAKQNIPDLDLKGVEIKDLDFRTAASELLKTFKSTPLRKDELAASEQATPNKTVISIGS